MVEDDQDTPPGRGGLVIAALGLMALVVSLTSDWFAKRTP